MSKTLGESDAIEDPNDDGQLTIRIPNPKVYMARQSQWVGRRGKPRCDQCRTSNLKCDRVLPVCNHCSWANHHECLYTPLPTPAHRGIPRCDHCREKNMKCDRNLPICNNCKESASPCNYTPKKRQKVLGDADSVSAPPGFAGGGQEMITHEPPLKPEHQRAHTFYGQNVAVFHSKSRSLSSSEADTTSDMDSSHTGRFTADFAKPKRSMSEYAQQAGIHVQPPPTKIEFISHPYSSERRIVLDTGHNIEPWTQPSFIPLPDYVRRCLQDVDLVEMPKKHEFELALQTFRQKMMEPLRETAFFPADQYARVARSLATGDVSRLSDRVRSWALVHRLCSGSDKHSVILVPQDSVFAMDAASAERHRRQFFSDLLGGKGDPDDLQVHHYDRLPVQDQLYDILTYAHRSHLPAAQMLVEIIRLRFASITWPMAEMYVRLCPLCNMRAKQLQEQAHQSISKA